jgi:hypothetical protein
MFVKQLQGSGEQHASEYVRGWLRVLLFWSSSFVFLVSFLY